MFEACDSVVKLARSARSKILCFIKSVFKFLSVIANVTELCLTLFMSRFMSRLHLVSIIVNVTGLCRHLRAEVEFSQTDFSPLSLP